MKITTVSRLFQRLQHHCVEAVLAFYHKVESRIPEDVGLVSKGLKINCSQPFILDSMGGGEHE
jgi:hypothetical protein